MIANGAKNVQTIFDYSIFIEHNHFIGLSHDKSSNLHRLALSQLIIAIGHELGHKKQFISTKGNNNYNNRKYVKDQYRKDKDSDQEADLFIETDVFRQSYLKITRKMSTLLLDPATYDDRTKMDKVILLAKKSKTRSTRRATGISCYSYRVNKNVEKI